MTLPDGHRVHWRQIIADLRARGLSCDQIGARLGRAEATVMGWRDGSQPKHHDGERLIDLWCQATGAHRDAAPVIHEFDYRA